MANFNMVQGGIDAALFDVHVVIGGPFADQRLTAASRISNVIGGSSLARMETTIAIVPTIAMAEPSDMPMA